MTKYTETDLELATLEWLEGLGYEIVWGPDIAPLDANNPDLPASSIDSTQARRASYGDVVLEGRLRTAIEKLNPNIPQDAKEEAFKKVAAVAHTTPNLIINNKIFHSYLRDGVDVEYMRLDGTVAGDKVRFW